MPTGLYFTPVVCSFFLFLTPNLWGYWMDLNQTWTLMAVIWKIWSELPSGIYPMGWGQKTVFLGPTLNFDLTYLCSGTWYQHSERNLSIYNLQGLAYMPQIWWTLFQKRLRTVGEFLPTQIFALGDTASLTASTLYNRQQANFGTCYVVARACSLEQQNAGQAHARLCHVSSYYCYY